MKVKADYIKSLIKLKSLKQKDVAAAINVVSQDWSNWMHRETFPHYNKLEELATLLNVETKELLAEGQHVFEPEVDYQVERPTTKNTIPFFDLERESAHGILSEGITNETPNDYVHIPGLSADFIINYYGLEMAPAISNGDLIALRQISDLSFFNFGHLYLVVTKEQIITRYIKSSSKDGHLILSAQNEAYDDIEIPKKKITAVYMIISIVKRHAI